MRIAAVANSGEAGFGLHLSSTLTDRGLPGFFNNDRPHYGNKNKERGYSSSGAL